MRDVRQLMINNQTPLLRAGVEAPSSAWWTATAKIYGLPTWAIAKQVQLVILLASSTR